MSRYVFAVFAILAIFSIGAMAAEPKCPPNEIWTECGSRCPPTCEERNPICTLECVPRCVCMEGYIRNKCGKCIPRGECPPKK